MEPETKAGASLSGLTENDAKEFHDLFMKSFVIFIGVAIFAHILAWIWRPWLPPVEGYSSLMDSVGTTVAQLSTFVA